MLCFSSQHNGLCGKVTAVMKKVNRLTEYFRERDLDTERDDVSCEASGEAHGCLWLAVVMVTLLVVGYVTDILLRRLIYEANHDHVRPPYQERSGRH